MRNFLNAIRGLPRLEERPIGASRRTHERYAVLFHTLEMPERPALLAVAAAMLALSGCGWTPLYGDPETGPASEELRAIHVDPIAERIGQRLEIALRNSLNPTGEPTPTRYRLSTALAVAL